MTDNASIEHDKGASIGTTFDVDATTQELLQLEGRSMMTGTLAATGVAATVTFTAITIEARNKEQKLRQQLSETPASKTVKTQALQEQIKDSENRQFSDTALEGIGVGALLATTVFVAGLYKARDLKRKFREADLCVPTIWPSY